MSQVEQSPARRYRQLIEIATTDHLRGTVVSQLVTTIGRFGVRRSVLELIPQAVAIGRGLDARTEGEITGPALRDALFFGQPDLRPPSNSPEDTQLTDSATHLAIVLEELRSRRIPFEEIPVLCRSPKALADAAEHS